MQGQKSNLTYSNLHWSLVLVRDLNTKQNGTLKTNLLVDGSLEDDPDLFPGGFSVVESRSAI